MPSSRWLLPGVLGTAWIITMCYFFVKGYKSSRQIIKVAFIGNSFQFVNDLPRVLEYFGNGLLQQDSMLHGSLNFYTMTLKGNGMFHRWNTSETAVNADGVIDYGACTLPQILLGYDVWLDDYQDFYVDDGKNPCFQDNEYLEYATAIRTPGDENNETDDYLSFQEHVPGPPWDYVILNDQSMRPTDWNNKRNRSGHVLETTYAPMLAQGQTIPILFMTWAYWRDDFDYMDTFVDIPTFTRRLYEGYQYYAKILEEALPETQQPRIAPVGLAFLVIWEENPAFWKEKLFSATDHFHPSPHGTYLTACVVYSTIYRHLPPAWTRFTNPVFERSRRMELDGDPLPLPTEDEALYLRHIAARVSLHGYMPKSLFQTADNGD
ncbi:hypothetical protein IV203_018220 [Nitzschia inconspicua]|uniref:Uncharacterized protein n=1 Tax=Nitzschia inconspicua TaxID=303405 RepID=A0A9K3M1C6_9STRA|nr:hypothetical protein IV203_018220 [Nitzschia inconspicua]